MCFLFLENNKNYSVRPKGHVWTWREFTAAAWSCHRTQRRAPLSSKSLDAARDG